MDFIFRIVPCDRQTSHYGSLGIAVFTGCLRASRLALTQALGPDYRKVVNGLASTAQAKERNRSTAKEKTVYK